MRPHEWKDAGPGRAQLGRVLLAIRSLGQNEFQPSLPNAQLIKDSVRDATGLRVKMLRPGTKDAAENCTLFPGMTESRA